MNKIIFLSGLIFITLFINSCSTQFIDENSNTNTEVSGETTSSGKIIRTTNGVKHSIPLNEILQGCFSGKDCIPSIDNPKFESTSEANLWLDDEDIIFGIDIEGEQKAYPQNILNWHEIVNDEIQGSYVAITFCPLCGSSLAFERIINNEIVEFGISGKLWNSDLVMYDRLTESYWNQISGEAIVGELTGMQLNQLPLHTTTYKNWKEQFPETLVLSKDTGFIRDYDKYPYGNYEESESINFPVNNKDQRLHPKAIVYGLNINNNQKAYPLNELPEGKTISDNFQNINYEITNNRGIITFINSKTSEEVYPVRNFWFAWVAHFPNTELYEN